MEKRFFILRALIIFGFIIFANKTSALTISPPLKEFGADPGSTVQGMIKIYNENNSEITVTPSISDFTAKPEGAGEPQFIDTSSPESNRELASWIKVPGGPFTVKPLDWQNITFEISIPKNAEPGGHYAAIFFSPNGAVPGKGNVSVDYKTGSLILLTVAGDTKQEGKLDNLIIKDNKKFFNYIPVSFEARIENSGNVHFRPGGGIEIKNIFGQKTTDLPILKEESGGNVLPNSIRKYEIVWGETEEKNLPQNFWNIVRYEWNNFHLGLYRATAVVGLPQGQSNPLIVTFWIIPWQLIVVVALGLAMIVALFKWYNRWIIKKARGEK